MNLEDPIVLNIRKTFEDNFRLLLNPAFIKEVFEEVVPIQNRANLDDRKMELIIARCFGIINEERIENIIDVQNQQPIVIRIALEETESGFLVHDSIFKITFVVNISEIKENNRKNTNNGCLKLTLSNGKETLFGLEEGKLLDIPADLTQLDGALIYVTKDTPIRRGIVLLNNLSSFVFRTMQQFKQGLSQLLQRVEKHNREVERLEMERERQRQLERERPTTQRTTTYAPTEMNEEEKVENFDEEMNVQIMEARQTVNQFDNQGFDEEDGSRREDNNQNNEVLQQNGFSAEECNELLSLLYD